MEQVDSTFEPDKRTALTLHPGISSLDTSADEDAARSYLLPLLTAAREHVPENAHAATPIFLKATAGARMLGSSAARSLMNKIRRVFADGPFRFEPSYVSILSGEEEGAFGWLTVNFASKRLQQRVGGDAPTATYGALDLGGASTQAALEPLPNEPLQHDFPMLIDREKIQLYSVSYLRFGLNEAIKRHLANLVLLPDFFSIASSSTGTDSLSSIGVVQDPCQLENYEGVETLEDGRSVSVVGAPDFDKCLEMTRALLHIDDYECFQRPCAMAGRYMPEEVGATSFVAFGGYFYVAAAIGLIEEGQRAWGDGDGQTIDDIVTKGRAFCTSDGGSALDEYSKSMCFGSAYVYNILASGLGISPSESGRVIIADALDNIDLGWAFGAALYELQLMEIVTAHDETIRTTNRRGGAASSSLQLLVASFIGAAVGGVLTAFVLVGHEHRKQNLRSRFLAMRSERRHGQRRRNSEAVESDEDQEDIGDDDRAPLLSANKEA
eukprot:g2210.t1